MSRARGRRAAAGPVVARSTFVAHERPARVVALGPSSTARAAVAPLAEAASADTAAAGTATVGTATAGTARSRSAALRAERAADPRHVRRAATAKRAALLIAPALAITSTLSLSIPADTATAAPAPTATTTTSQDLQTYTVAHDVEVPIISSDGVTTTSVVSYPTLVLRFGVTEAQAQAALSAALSPGGDRSTVLQTALQYLGDPYLEGGASHAGIDCSGLTMVAYQAVGIQLAHYVPTQDAVATTVPESEAAPGGHGGLRQRGPRRPVPRAGTRAPGTAPGRGRRHRPHVLDAAPLRSAAARRVLTTRVGTTVPQETGGRTREGLRASRKLE
ncbi:NlpC/P60 family protein [Curtobacterium sp. MCJR17_043]|nr:NlpC/P60 family protein [Curtobacterium sp. MCJR17_043]WIB36935.1 NlpC/P60 family protein [Curtobacterium sp. MCJR17_043]